MLAAIMIGMAFTVLLSSTAINFEQLTLNPFAPASGIYKGASPPKIVLFHDGQIYDGQLVGFTYDKNKPLAGLPVVDIGNITLDESRQIAIQQGAKISFEMLNNPPSESQPDSLSVSVYTEQDNRIGKGVTVLGANQTINDNNTQKSPDNSFPYNKNNTYQVNLPKGEYVLLSIATWVADQERQTIDGYVIYGFRIAVE